MGYQITKLYQVTFSNAENGDILEKENFEKKGKFYNIDDDINFFINAVFDVNIDIDYKTELIDAY